MYGLFAGITTLDVAQLVAQPVPENQKVTSEGNFIAAGGPATNAAVTFAVLDEVCGGGNRAVLASAVGVGAAARLITEDLGSCGIALVDCTQCEGSDQSLDPAVSNVVVNRTNGTRTLVSTNAELPLKVNTLTDLMSKLGDPSVVLVDGYNPVLAHAALTWKAPEDTGITPFASQDFKPKYLRILDGGSWKPWLTPLLGYIDVAVISADFTSPGSKSIEQTIEFLRGFGITKVIQTRGEAAVHWWWNDRQGEVFPPRVETVCTLGAGDVFHGSIAWACAKGYLNAGTEDPSAVVEFASQIAAHSTTSFGTRKWCADRSAVARIMRDHSFDPAG